MGKTVSLRVPGAEANKLKAGEPAAIALVSGNSICVCVAAAPITETSALKRWLDGWNCP
jgi:hypothetical protein